MVRERGGVGFSFMGLSLAQPCDLPARPGSAAINLIPDFPALEAAMRALSTATLLTCTLALLLVGASAPAFAQKVYQWKDAKGVTHYSDSPPPSQQFQDRRIDNRGEPVPQDVAAGKSVESPQCISARLNLSLLAGKSALQQDTDGDGKPDKVLGEEDRANQRNLADAAVKAYCPPAATAGR